MRPLPQHLRPTFLSAALAALSIALGAPACEPRIEEPVPPIRRESSRASGDKTAQTAGEQGAEGAGRCVRPTPEKPARQVPPGSVSPDPDCPADPEGSPTLRSGKVVFKDAGKKEVRVEIAENDKTRQRGLMYRKAMEEDRGMIFLFEHRQSHSFWMHNTCIPLDMLFIDDDGLIVGIEESTPTMDDSSFEVGCPSRYVLEVNAGWTRKNGVKAGQRVELQGI